MANFLVDVEIPEGIIEITENTIENHRNVRSVKIPESVLVIGDRAFADCVNLKEIKIPDTVKVIGKDAFCMCASLYEISIPDSVMEIKNHTEDEQNYQGTFAGCISLTYVKLPNNIKNIGYR